MRLLLPQANHSNNPRSNLSSLYTDAPAEEEEEDIDLFGDDDEDDAEAERLKAERVAAYAAKKATKPKTVAKSVVTFEVKPWDDETDMVALENAVRSIELDGLVWGASKLVAVGYGIKKLQITIVIGTSTGPIPVVGADLFRLQRTIRSHLTICKKRSPSLTTTSRAQILRPCKVRWITLPCREPLLTYQPNRALIVAYV